jgi:hypothetical protein
VVIAGQMPVAQTETYSTLTILQLTLRVVFTSPSLMVASMPAQRVTTHSPKILEQVVVLFTS